MNRVDLTALRVAVVDDSEPMRKLLALMLTAFGVRQVRVFADGIAAMEAMQAEAFDLLLCDWHMRPVDGLTLTRRIRHFEDGGLAGMPIIMVTGTTDEVRLREACAAGVSYVVVKPITPAVLLDRIVWAITNPSPAPPEDCLAARGEAGGAGRAPAPMP